MNKEIYTYIKNYLNHYDFEQKSNFTGLYQDFPNWDNPMPFKKFVAYCKLMGVRSVVRRQADGSLLRYVEYERILDKLIVKVFTELMTCPTCKGKGVVKK